MRPLLVLLLLALVSGCQGGDEQSVATSAPAPEAHYVGADGIQLRVPAGWFESSTSASAVSDPVIRLVVSSAPIRPRDSDCQTSSFTLAEGAVSIVVVEWVKLNARLRVRPQRFDEDVLPLRRGTHECFDGPAGVVQFIDSGRALGAYVFLGEEAPLALARRAREVLETLIVDPALPEAVELVPLAAKRLEHCRRSPLLSTICPTYVPRVNAPYLSHLARDPARALGEMHVFNLERGGEDPQRPETNRPPRMAHIGLLAGDTERIAPWREPWGRPARPLRNGVLSLPRSQPISFGLVRVGDTRALLYLAPPYPTGGYLGNHLVLSWRTNDGGRAVSLHAWEPLTEAAATLWRMAMSAANVAGGARLSAYADADGVLYVDGGGWTCPGKVLVDLPEPWAETAVQPKNVGEFHLTYPRPEVRPYQGTVTARQACGSGDELRAETEIVG
jgi:hypothetical protein